MKFYCLCMSPAIDATVRLNAWPKDGDVIKNVAETENAGGKGLNVARWISLRGGETVCGGLLGADNVALFEREMARWNLNDHFVRVEGSTRRNEMIVTPQGEFKLNRPAFPRLAVEDCGRVIDSFGLTAGSVAVISGSLPAAAPKGFYASVIRAAKAAGAKTVLDTSGEALRRGVEAGPDLIKPNADECGELVGFVPKTPGEFKKATELLRRKVGMVIISDGASGAWFNGEFVAAPKVEVLDTTAAGDTLLAEFCWRIFGTAATVPVAAAWAVAAGSAEVTRSGSEPPPATLVAELLEKMNPRQ